MDYTQDGIPEGALVITQSTIESLELSPCRVTTLPEGVKVQPSWAMFRGTLQHAIIERTLTVPGFNGHSARAIQNLFEELADKEGYTVEALLEGFKLDNAIDQAIYLHKDWEKTVLRGWLVDLEPVVVEQPFARFVGLLSNGQELWVATRGVDYVGLHHDGGYKGADWKTTGRPWNKGAGSGKPQDDMYAYMVAPELGVVTDWSFWVGDWQRMEWNEYPTQVTPDSVWATMARVVNWAEFLILPNRPHLCTPSDGKVRGWWAKPNYNHGYCPTCKWLADPTDREWRLLENA